MFQTMKSIIRKNKYIESYTKEEFLNLYKEKINYYYIDYNEKDIANLIFTNGEIKLLKETDSKFLKILENNNTLNKLIYNINSNSIEQEKEQEKEEEKEEENEQEKEEIKEQEKVFNKNIYPEFYPKTPQLILDNSYINMINNRNYAKYCLRLDTNIYVMPDVFSNYDWKSNYMAGIYDIYVFIYVYLIPTEVLIICNIQNFMYFYNKYPILTLDLNLLNKEMSTHINEDFYNRFTKIPYIRIFSNTKYKNEIKKISDETNWKKNAIFILLLHYIKNRQTIITDIQKEYIDYIYGNDFIRLYEKLCYNFNSLINHYLTNDVVEIKNYKINFKHEYIKKMILTYISY